MKQVIVMRHDLGMRRGKQIAQGAHASLTVSLNMLNSGNKKTVEAFTNWFKDGQRKICVQVNSEQELLDVYNKALAAKLPAVLITDAGHTEFGGVPTKTCVAIGPAPAKVIDTITGSLKLY